jgi:hypothetical protein
MTSPTSCAPAAVSAIVVTEGTSSTIGTVASRSTSLRFGETLYLEGLLPSIGSVGDAYDNALAETTIGLYTTECVREDPPFRTGPLHTLGDVEHITAAWPTGTTQPGSCTASADAHRPRSKPNTMLEPNKADRPITQHEVCIKPG